VNKKALLAAAVLAVAGIALLWVYMMRFEEEAFGGTPVAVVVATEDIPLGAALTEDMLGARALPQAYVEERHVRVDDGDRVVGIRVRSAVKAGEAILWTDLAATTQHSRDLSALVSDGMRAVTIAAAVSSTFGGLLRPGDRVDVLLTTMRSGQPVTVTLLQNILVLAFGQDVGGMMGAAGAAADHGYRRVNEVTLSVTIEQAQLMALSEQQGSLLLVMRNPEDIRVAEGLPEATPADIIEPERRARIQQRRTGPQRVQ
jgi:pilus assembly protein CpaB